jgi:hypothetical protein
MQKQLKYVELKTGYADDGPAWIGNAAFSKTGRTVYFNGRAFKGNGHGLCSDLETHEVYWISGIKKNGLDWHWAGRGKIKIDRNIVREYLAIVGLTTLDTAKYEVVELLETDKTKFTEMENSIIDGQNENYGSQDLTGFSIPELTNIIAELKEKENSTNSNNGIKYYTIIRMEAEKYLNELQRQS